jgi:hypothetical protein
LGIKKEGLKEFVEHTTKNRKIHYADGKADRINPKTRKAFTAWKKYLAEHASGLSAEIEKANGEVAGLVLVSVLVSLSATLQETTTDDQPYYKSRFSILPRIALSELYEELNAEDKLAAKSLLVEVAKNWRDADLPQTFRNWTYEEKDKSKFTELAQLEYQVKDQLESVFDDAKRSDKTFARYRKEKKKVDLISSDAVASTSEVGESVGAYQPDKDHALKELSGLFELRWSMPSVNIEDEASVKAVYEKTLESYGDMP